MEPSELHLDHWDKPKKGELYSDIETSGEYIFYPYYDPDDSISMQTYSIDANSSFKYTTADNKFQIFHKWPETKTMRAFPKSACIGEQHNVGGTVINTF